MRADDIAREWIGTPYVHQASTMGAGADCLGLLRGVWRELYGQEPRAIPAYSQDWGETSDHEILWEAAADILRPAASGDIADGEVLLFRMRQGCVAKHLGICANRDGLPSFIHSFSGHGVVESLLTRPWRRRIVARFEFPKRIN